MSVPVLLGLFALLGAARSDGDESSSPIALERALESAPSAKRNADDLPSEHGQDGGEERRSEDGSRSGSGGETRESGFASHSLRASVDEAPQPTCASRSGTHKPSRLHAIGRTPSASLRGEPFPRVTWITLPDSPSPLSVAARAPHSPRGPPLPS